MEETIMILGEPMPVSMYKDFAEMITPTLKGYQFSCAPKDFECPICCCSDNNMAVVLTECNHFYHLECVERWIEVRNTCPTCRNVMPTYTRKLVEDLLNGVREQMKTKILEEWYAKLEGLSQKELGIVKKQMNSFCESSGWK